MDVSDPIQMQWIHYPTMEAAKTNKGEGTPLSLLLPYDEDVLTKAAGGANWTLQQLDSATGFCIVFFCMDI